MNHKDAGEIMRQYCAAHRIRLLSPDPNPDRNEGGQSGRTIWLGEFDDADCLVNAFFHEVGHIIDGRKGFHRNHRVSVFERELRAWAFGLEEMHKFGIGTDAKAIGYMMDRLSRYAAKEGGVGGPKPLKPYSVVCNCGANGPDAPTPEAAVAAWNRRANEGGRE